MSEAGEAGSTRVASRAGFATNVSTDAGAEGTRCLLERLLMQKRYGMWIVVRVKQ
ncbi:MAG: hypothetical protein OEW48_16815 [Phycisphaerae bacterium]|nr:hypothetical protein [Phycisphaerae bacterium]